jgi:tRNA-dihydrouridine synthase B
MKIGSLDLNGNVFLAPMAGITDLPFRLIVEKFGVSALWTEMLSCNAVVNSRKKLRSMDVSGHRTPTVFQICGNDPLVMAESARIAVDGGASVVDVNMGCPSRKVVNGGSGAALMRNVPLAAAIVSAVRRAVKLPLTVKIRSGWDGKTQNAPEVARTMEAEGADAIIVHSRPRSEVHSGEVSLEVIRKVKESVKIPVVGNGGIQSVDDSAQMIEASGCDGVMVGRGALGRPWLPSLILSWTNPLKFPGLNPVKILDVVREHFGLQIEHYGFERAVRQMRKHWAWYSKGLLGATEFRRLVFREVDPSCVMQRAEEFFGKEQMR